MANIYHIEPNAPVKGFRAQVATLTPGIAVIRGTANDQANIAGAAPAAILGIVDLDQQLPKVGDTVAVRLACPGDLAYVQAGGAIAIDAKLSVNASGQFVTGTTGQKALAKALAPAAAAGDLIPVIILDGDLSL